MLPTKVLHRLKKSSKSIEVFQRSASRNIKLMKKAFKDHVDTESFETEGVVSEIRDCIVEIELFHKEAVRCSMIIR